MNTCEVIIGSRAKAAKPMLCGRRGGAYRMIGGLGSVVTTLCEKHAKAVTKDGRRLVPLDRKPPVDVRQTPSVGDSEIQEPKDETPVLFPSPVKHSVEI